MRYIAALISRNTHGDLVVDEASVRKGNSLDIQEKVSARTGDMTGVWRHPDRDQMSTDEARQWVDMVLPDYLYMRASWNEYVLLSGHYRNQIEGD